MKFTTDYQEFLNSKEYELVHCGAFHIILIYKITNTVVRVLEDRKSFYATIERRDEDWICMYSDISLYNLSLLAEFL